MQPDVKAMSDNSAVLSVPQVGAWGEIETLLQETEQKLASGKFYGIGELIVRHFAYTTGRHAELDNPIYSTFTRRLSDIAMRFDVPIVIHMEGEPGLVADFSRPIDEYGTVRYVWAHNCGRSQAPVIREVLTRHPNLMCDLGGMTNIGKQNYGTGRPHMESYTAHQTPAPVKDDRGRVE
jgi:hypothetical protein